MTGGGRYEMKDGKRVRIEGTRDHPEGNRARDKDGKPLDPAPVARKTSPKKK